MIESYKELGVIQESIYLLLEDLVVIGTNVSDIYKFILDQFQKNNLEIISDSIPVSVNINNKVFHGVETLDTLKDGDILTIDTCFKKDSKIIDGARTFIVGEQPQDVLNLIHCNKKLFSFLLPYLKSGLRVCELLKLISDFVSLERLYLIAEGVGHGIYPELHSSPFISYKDFTDFNYQFKEGDIFTIEPILLLQESSIYLNNLGEGFIDNGCVSSQFEISVLIGNDGCGIYLNSGLLK